jgi:hypothetical protein
LHVSTTARPEPADRQARDVPAAADTESADHDSANVISGAHAEPANSQSGEVLLHPDAKESDARPLDATGASHGEAERQPLYYATILRVGRPDRRVDTDDALQIAVAEVQPNSANKSGITDAQSRVVDHEVETLGSGQTGKNDHGGQQDSHAKGHTQSGRVHGSPVPTLPATRGFGGQRVVLPARTLSVRRRSSAQPLITSMETS